MTRAAAPADPPAADPSGPPAARRIAVVNWRDPWHPQAGGAERYAWELARRFAAGGADVCFVAGRTPGRRRRDRVDGVEFVRLGGRFTIYPLVLAWMLAHRRAFDAVLDCQNGIPFFTPWVLPRRVPVLCVVHHVHDDQFGMYFPPWLARFGRFLEGPVARRAYRRHACVAVSPSTVTALRERLHWTGPIHIVPNGVTVPGTPADATSGEAASGRAVLDGDVEQDRGDIVLGGDTEQGRDIVLDGDAEQDRDAVLDGHAVLDGDAAPDSDAAPDGDAEPGRITLVEGDAEPDRVAELVCVSRLVPHKRVAELLDVAERLRVRVHVIGRGPEEAALRAEIDRRGLTGLVELHGYLPEADKTALVARARLHVSASRGEGWGLSVTEAAALGVPTVAYDADGLRDAVLDGVTGWLARDGEHLADVVERALKELADPARRRQVAVACREWAAEFAWARSATRMSALLDAAVRRARSVGRKNAPRRGTAWNGSPRSGTARVGPGAAAGGTRPFDAPASGPLPASAPLGSALPASAPLGSALPGSIPSGAALPDAVVVRYGGTEQVVEGPVRDELLARLDPAAIDVRPATDLERLLGHTGRWAR